MEDYRTPPPKGIRRILWIGWMSLMYLIDATVDMIGENVGVVRREFEIFLGTTLFIIGFFSFESDKYCDGNTASYLSCTRPSTYYYYDWLDIALLVVGAFFILAWVLKRRGLR